LFSDTDYHKRKDNSTGVKIDISSNHGIIKQHLNYQTSSPGGCVSGSSSVGAAAAVIGGIGAAYWFAMAALALAAFMTVGVLVGIILAIYVSWGVILYVSAASQAFSKGDLDSVSALIVAPLTAPLAFAAAIVFTGLLGVPSYIEWLTMWSEGIDSDSISPVMQLLGFIPAIAWTFAVWPFIFVGWIIAGKKGYKSSSWTTAVWWWSLWGIALGFSLDPNLWLEFLGLVF
jgi:hypothetical protein